MPPPPSPLPRELAERYRPRRELGAGAFGAVLAVHDTDLDRTLALKQARPEVALTQELLERFLQEGRLLAQVSHPNLLRIYQAGVSEGLPWLLTEILEGQSLETPPEAARLPEIAVGIAAALESLHTQGVLHRDVKPANLFLTKDNRPVLLDLGLALPAEAMALTATGAVVGTPAFLAPEIFRGTDASPASDWFALGASLFWLAEGRAPYPLLELASPTPRPLPELEFRVVPDRGPLASLLRALLAADPDRRPADADDVRDLLRLDAPTLTAESDAFLAISSSSHQPPQAPAPRRRRGPLLAGLGLLAVVLGAWWTPAAPEPAAPAAKPTVPVPRDLVSLSRRFDVFLPASKDLDELRAHRHLRVKELVDVALHRRWKRYLASLRGWLLEAHQGASTEAEFEHRLMGSGQLADFRRLALRIPPRLFWTSKRTGEWAYGSVLLTPDTAALSPASWDLLAGRKLSVLRVPYDLRQAARDWNAALPPSLKARRLFRLMWLGWIEDSPINTLETASSDLFNELLPAFQETPLAPATLATAAAYLDKDTLREPVDCREQAARAGALLAAVEGLSEPLEEHHDLNAAGLIGVALDRLRGACPDAGMGGLKRRLLAHLEAGPGA